MSTPFETFWASQDWAALERVNGWTVTRDGDRVWLSLAAGDGERFLVRLACDDYPASAPSVAFINDSGSTADSRSWPIGKGEFHSVVKLPPACFLCMPLTREGLAHHPEWRGLASAWHERRTLFDLINYLRRLLNGAEYTGRGG